MARQKDAETEALVDNLIEDEAQKERLLSKPTCFVIFGRPGVGKSTLGKKLADSWKCILIDDTDLIDTNIKNKTKKGKELQEILSEGKSIPEDVMLQLILDRLTIPDVEHYGYVLTCLPCMSEECLNIHDQIDAIKNLKLAPDFIINIKCPDKDLVQRLSSFKQDPVTGLLYSRDQWKDKNVNDKKENEEDQGLEEEEEEKVKEAFILKECIDQMVWIPENLPKNAFDRITMYKDKLLRPLEDHMMDHNPLYLLELDGSSSPKELHQNVMSRLDSLAIDRVALPVLLCQKDDEDPLESNEKEDILRFMTARRTVAPGLRWRRSRWGKTCPVALREGNFLPGKLEFSVGFQDKLYVLSSEEAYQKFVLNPRRFLLPPMPRPPCKVSIVGPPLAGKSTMCQRLAQHYGAVVIDPEELLKPVLAKAEQERLAKTTQAAIDKVKLKVEDSEQNSVTEDHPEVKATVFDAVQNYKPIEPSLNVLKEKMKEIEKLNSSLKTITGWVLDNFPKNNSQIKALQELGILPDTIFFLGDSERHNVLKRIYEMNKANVNKAINERLEAEKLQRSQTLAENKQGSNLETIFEENDDFLDETEDATEENSETMNQDELDFIVEFGYPDVPEMEKYKVQLDRFQEEWTRMQSLLSVSHPALDIGKKSPEILLQEMVQHMEKPFQYMCWELSERDQDEEEEDLMALTAFDKDGTNDSGVEEEDEEVAPNLRRSLGDTKHFCPVTFQRLNILSPCTVEISAKYREKTFYFSSMDAREAFIQNPVQFIAQTGPLKPPALRIFLLGVRGSGKSTLGHWLAKKLGLFHIQFRAQLQMLIAAKANKPVPRDDEVMTLKNDFVGLEALIKQEMEEDVDAMEANSSSISGTKQQPIMTEDELEIKSYLSSVNSLSTKLLDTVIAPYWEQEPYMSTGFILEGFPDDPEQVRYTLLKQFFPDVVVMLEADVEDVQKRLLPTFLEIWQKLREKREEQYKLLQHLREKNRLKNIAKRREELLAEYDSKEGIKKSMYDKEQDLDEEGVEDLFEDEINAILEDEFPPEEESPEMENLETKDVANMRLELEIETRFGTDENNLTDVMQLLNEVNIPKLVVNTSTKLQVVQHNLFQKIQPLFANRESLFQTCQPISYKLAFRLLHSSYKVHSSFGYWDPIQQYKERDIIQPLQWPPDATYPLLLNQYIYFFATQKTRSTFMLNPLKYLRQPKPKPTLPVKMTLLGPPKSGKTTVARMFAQKYGLAHLSIGGVMRKVLNEKKNTDLALQMKMYLSQGHVVPDELAIQCLEMVLLSSPCTIQGFVLDGFPMTLKQAELMNLQSIIPMIAIELELDCLEVLKRGLVDKINPNKSHLKHDSSDILHSRNSIYKKEVEKIRQYFQEQYRNWFILDGQKNKWWIWSHILKELSISMKRIYTYIERAQSGQASCIYRLCITPKELSSQLGELGHYCPVCLATQHHLKDCSQTVALTHSAEYKKQYYRLCGENHLERFLSTPDKFVTPGCPHNLPPTHLRPKMLTAAQVKDKFPQQAEMKGFCPVTYLDGKQRYEALVRGQLDCAVEYRERIYIFETVEKQDKFMRAPEIYWDQKLPCKIPTLSEPVNLTSLPTLGYLEQGVPVIKALTALGSLKPKYPFLSIKRSALLYMAFQLKAFNQKSTDYSRQKYKRKLAMFEEDCALVPYLSSAMRHFVPCSERPKDLDIKLKRFLSLQVPGVGGVVDSHV